MNGGKHVYYKIGGWVFFTEKYTTKVFVELVSAAMNISPPKDCKICKRAGWPGILGS
ncbi:MAG: hypothetical protein OXI27_01455 [Thaumarchaeota archaeon]|nr:hypothetical protein [Nitrososphaerota archaeon]